MRTSLTGRPFQITAAVLLSATLSASALAQSPTDDSLQVRLAALQRQLQALQVEAATASKPADARASEGSLEERVEELSTQIKVLARQVELDKEQAAERAKTTPQPAAGRTGFSIQSADGNFRLRLRGYVQSEGRFFLNDSEQRGVDTLVLRRVRPIVETTIYRIFDLRVMPDFAGGAALLQDAYIDARLTPQFKIRAGKFKPPLGFERLMSPIEMPFIERALPTSLAPTRDLGIMAHGDLAGGNLAYAAGIFNGVQDGGSADADIQDSKDVVARLFAQPFRTRRDSIFQGLGFGVAGSYGNQRGVSAASSGLPTYRTSAQVPFFVFRGDDPVLGPVLANGTHTRFSLQGHYYFRNFSLLGEHILSSQNVRRAATAATLDNNAWQVAGSWVLTGETPSYRGVVPRSSFDAAAGTWGAFELTARYNVLKVDRAAFPVFANAATQSRAAEAYAAGLNWFLNTGVRLQVNYERTRFESAGAARRRDEHNILTRIQFAF